MLELGVVSLVDAIILCCLIDLDNRSIEDESTIIALRLKSLAIHVLITYEGTVDQSRSSLNGGGFFLLFLLTVEVKLILRVIEVPVVALLVGLPMVSVLLGRLLLGPAGLLDARHEAIHL